MKQTIIKCAGISKTFFKGKPNENTPLKEISLSINEGEVVLLKGTSGSGKTTLLSIIGLLTKPTSGALQLMQQPISKWSEKHLTTLRQNHIGFIFQRFNLIDDLTVADNIGIPLLPIGISGKALKAKVEQVAKDAGIQHKLSTQAKYLSGGEMQRVAIARALINDPEIIMADEPTAHLDEENSINIIETLKKLKELNKTIIITTHDPIFEKNIIHDRVINMINGEIIG